MSRLPTRLLSALSALSLSALLCQCGTLDKLPKVNLNLHVPFVGEPSSTTAASSNDPFIPYDIRQQLVPGHTIVVDVYAGQRSPNRIFSDRVIIAEDGTGDFGKHGKARLAGLDATQALRSISSLFNAKRGDRILNIQLKNIEDLPLLTVEGSVKHPSVVRWFGTADPLTILPYVGGRTGSGSAVYITREGIRRFYTSLQSASSSGTLMAGDIVTYTGDL